MYLQGLLEPLAPKSYGGNSTGLGDDVLEVLRRRRCPDLLQLLEAAPAGLQERFSPFLGIRVLDGQHRIPFDPHHPLYVPRTATAVRADPDEKAIK